MKKITSKILLVGLMITGLALSLFFLEQKGFFAVGQIEIFTSISEQQKNFSAPLVEKLDIKLKKFYGQSIWKISLNDIVEELRQEKWIKEFRVSRSWPDSIVMEIEPHRLAFLYVEPQKLAKGIVLPVNENGDLMSEISTEQAPSLAMLSGAVFSKDKSKRLKAIELLKALPENGKVNHKIISEVGYDQKNGFWLEVIQTRIKVILGEDQFAMKSSRVSQVLDYLDKRDLKARVIDANLSKKVLVRLQQNP